jgi:hypothetical protein
MHLDHNDRAEEEYRRLERSEMKKKDHLLLVYDNYGHLLAQQNRVDEIRTFVLPLLPHFGGKALRLELEESTFLQLQAKASQKGRRTDASNSTLQV